MSQFRSRISGTGSYLPQKSVTNFDLEKIVDTSDEWIRERTGIQSRHFAAPEEATSDLAYEAALKALEMAQMKATDLDAILVGTVTPDHSLPSTACILQARLGCRPIFALDVSAACSGFVYAATIADSLIKSGNYKNILVIGAETLSRILNFKDRQTCILFGDGAGAAIFSRAKDQEPSEVFTTTLWSDGEGGKNLNVPAGGSRMPLNEQNILENKQFVHMEGKEIFKAAVTTIKEGTLKVITEAGYTPENVDWYLFHQANIRIIETIVRQLKCDEKKILSNIDHVGNTSGASIPILLDESIRSGKIKRGDVLLLSAFGAGLTAGSLLLKY